MSKQEPARGRADWGITMIQDSPKHFRGACVNGSVGGQTGGVALNPTATAEAVYESPVFELENEFNDLVLSWNIESPAATGVGIEARVGRAGEEGWSPWLYFGDWGNVSPRSERIVTFPDGRVDTDYLRSAVNLKRLQYRIRAAGTGQVFVDRFAVCASRRIDRSASPAPAPSTNSDLPPTGPWTKRLPVPFRSQKAESAEIAGRICSPTSLAMVMAHYGVDRSTGEVAQRCFDPEHRIYGNWPRNIQAAFSFGVPGYLTRVLNWREVEKFIAEGRPLIASIRVPQSGGLRGAPYQTTDGHLIVICGFDGFGNVEVNDPAASEPLAGQTCYARIELESAWFDGSGGLTYVLMPPSRRR